LVRKQLITVAGHRNECIEEKKAFQSAKQRLESTEEKLRTIRAWSVKLHRAVDEFQSRVGRLEQSVGEGVPRFLGVLERVTASLDAYAEERPHAAADLAPVAPGAMTRAATPSATEPPA
jgi:hypothetical protein